MYTDRLNADDQQEWGKQLLHLIDDLEDALVAGDPQVSSGWGGP